mgnify:CR=1 FL=1
MRPWHYRRYIRFITSLVLESALMYHTYSKTTTSLANSKKKRKKRKRREESQQLLCSTKQWASHLITEIAPAYMPQFVFRTQTFVCTTCQRTRSVKMVLLNPAMTFKDRMSNSSSILQVGFHGCPRQPDLNKYSGVFGYWWMTHITLESRTQHKDKWTYSRLGFSSRPHLPSPCHLWTAK